MSVVYRDKEDKCAVLKPGFSKRNLESWNQDPREAGGRFQGGIL